MSDDLSPRLSLPYLHPSQAQKHVTHNEALRLLDLLVQPVVLSRSTTSPPSDPLLGMCYVVASGAGGAFAGQAGKIAAYEVSGWAFLTPVAGWRVLVLDEAVEIRFDGTTWVGPEASTLRLAGLGIGTPSDAINRLAVRSPASLFCHDGAGHRLMLNKAETEETASLVFQTDWSGRAEIGCSGTDDFEIRTSFDGGGFATALRARAADGRVEVPNGIALTGTGSAALPTLRLGEGATGLWPLPTAGLAFAVEGETRLVLDENGAELAGRLRGEAVSQSALYTSSGRLLKVGDAGVLGTAPLWEGNCDAAPAGATVASGEITEAAAALAGWPSVPGAHGGTLRRYLLHTRRGHAGECLQEASECLGNGPSHSGRNWRRSRMPGGGWTPWRRLQDAAEWLGPVGMEGGLPTGGAFRARIDWRGAL